MKKILLTGGSGFIGTHVFNILKEKYDIIAPSRQELDVRDGLAVSQFIVNSKFDIIIHLATPSPARSPDADSYDKLFEDSIKIFMNFYSVRNYCEKILYSGSGAEYDKRFDIMSVEEEEIGKSIPIDEYGMAKYIINNMIRSSKNIYNLRLFGCFGPGEHNSKFITHAVRCALNNQSITIRQNCLFDYIYIDNYVKYLEYFINNTPKFHDYNAVSGRRVSLIEIAGIVATKLESMHNYSVEKAGYNREYTANNSRILQETKLDKELLTLEDGIDRLIIYEKHRYKTEKS